MLSLIINADDFGQNEIVNNEVIKSYQFGLLRSASLMANGDSFYHAVKVIKENPELDIGVHITLVQQTSLLDSGLVKTLVNEKGRFYNNGINFAQEYLLNKINLSEVRSECAAQIEKIMDHGIKLSHIDSHQHIHVLPGIFKIIKDLAKKYNIEFIRTPNEKIKGYMFRDHRLYGRIFQMLALNLLCGNLNLNNSYSLNHFAGFYFGGHLSKKNFLTIIQNLPSEGICELMCHPGLFMCEGSDDNYRTVEESLALRDEEVKNLLLKKNIRITSFAKLN